MRPVDALVNAVRRAINRVLPYYDPKEAARRDAERGNIRAETDRVHVRSMVARLRAEGFDPKQAQDIAERYRRQDAAIRR